MRLLFKGQRFINVKLFAVGSSIADYFTESCLCRWTIRIRELLNIKWENGVSIIPDGYDAVPGANQIVHIQKRLSAKSANKRVLDMRDIGYLYSRSSKVVYSTLINYKNSSFLYRLPD